MQSESLDAEQKKFEVEKKKLHDQINFLQNKLNGTVTSSVQVGADDRTRQLLAERDRAVGEVQQLRADLEAVRKAAKSYEEGMKRKEADLLRSIHREEETALERNEFQKACEGLETRVMVLEMEKKNIQQIEERKYQVCSCSCFSVFGKFPEAKTS